ncbi:MAG: hypothetical protein HW388_1785, partial [Dehalococcoidia bacterium]|nr:hypothetical protein [Dehalococcoidia bacterium]
MATKTKTKSDPKVIFDEELLQE